jgi:phosphonopyruvate decarboxylase
MIKPEIFFKKLVKSKIDFFVGVPDSLLSDICAYITDNVSPSKHIITANEGNAIANAVGYNLASGKIPLVYLQNSGLGNIINPILSIADDKVYSIPMIILMGWRGEPGVKDEPQHVRQGEVNEALLDAMQLPYTIMDNTSNSEIVIEQAIKIAVKFSKPYVILVRKDTFEKYKLVNDLRTSYPLVREDVVKMIVDALKKDDIVVSTTGKTSRELFEYRECLGHEHDKDFLTVGGMGHTSSIALGIAIEKKDRNVYCLDGDGSFIMHMGALAINGSIKELDNFKHIVINNGAHDSVGGQPTLGFQIDMVSIAKACGYSFATSAESIHSIKKSLENLANHKGRGFLEIKVNKGARENLGRPTTSTLENKIAFIKFLEHGSDSV